MNRKKLNEYNVIGSVHTASIRSPGQVVNNGNQKVIDSVYSAKKDTTTSIINPNKVAEDIMA